MTKPFVRGQFAPLPPRFHPSYAVKDWDSYMVCRGVHKTIAKMWGARLVEVCVRCRHWEGLGCLSS